MGDIWLGRAISCAEYIVARRTSAGAMERGDRARTSTRPASFPTTCSRASASGPPPTTARTRSPSEDLAELTAAGYLAILVPRELGGAGLGPRRGVRPAAAPRRRRARDGARDQHAPRVDRRREGARRPRHRRPALRAGGRGRGRGLRVRHQRGRQRSGAVRQRHGCRAAARRRVRVHGHEDLHLARPRCGRSSACTASTRPRPTARRWSTRSCRGRRRLPAASSSATTGTPSACAARSRARPSCTARSPRPTASCGASHPGPNPDPIVFGIFSVFELLLASVYTGIARRALDLAVETARHAPLEEDRPGATARTPTSAGASPTWRSPTTPCRRRSPRSAATSTTLADHGARWFSLLVGRQAPRGDDGQARRRRRDPRLGRLVVLLRERAQPPLPRRARRLFHPSDPESAHSTVASAWLGPVEDRSHDARTPTAC